MYEWWCLNNWWLFSNVKWIWRHWEWKIEQKWDRILFACIGGFKVKTYSECSNFKDSNVNFDVIFPWETICYQAFSSEMKSPKYDSIVALAHLLSNLSKDITRMYWAHRTKQLVNLKILSLYDLIHWFMF